MLGADQTVTIVNRWYDGTNDADREQEFRLDGVSVFYDCSAGTSNGGTSATDLVRIRIPFRKDYLPEDQWKQDHPADKWTLRLEDKVIVGGQSRTVLRIHDNTIRRFQPHWYVEVR